MKRNHAAASAPDGPAQTYKTPVDVEVRLEIAADLPTSELFHRFRDAVASAPLALTDELTVRRGDAPDVVAA